MRKTLGIVVASFVSIANVASAGTPDTNGRFVVYSGSYPSTVTGLGGIPASVPVTILIDTMTGRSWKLIRDHTGTKWSPFNFLPTQMAGDGTPLLPGTIVPQPIAGIGGQR